MPNQNSKEILDKILSCAKKEGVSDILISPNSAPHVRLNGKLVVVSDVVLSSEDIEEMIKSFLSEKQQAQLKKERSLDYAFDYHDYCRFRSNIFYNIYGLSAVFRKIDKEIPTLEGIKAPKVLYDLCGKDHGLIILTGPTGSGKSTTIAAMINHMIKNTSKHIITIEDPVEFVYKSKGKSACLVNQRQVGQSVNGFADALRSALRQDPDVILVGEMRDPETVHLALTAAETGHLVLSTLHTNNAPEAVNRIIDVFPEGSKDMAQTLLSASLLGIVSQKLVSASGGGRAALHEVLIATPAVKNLIRERNIPQLYSMMQVGAKYGMKTIEDSAAELVRKGIIDVDTYNEIKAIKRSKFEE